MQYTVFPDTSAKSKRDISTTWDAFAAQFSNPREYPTKEDCPLLSLATYGDTRSDKNSLRHESNMLAVHGVEGDYDAGLVSVAEVGRRVTAAGMAAVIYTTARHTPDAPRWRVLAPLSKPCTPAERWRLVGILNAALGGILASESFTPSQSFYFGRVHGVDYDSRHVPGAAIDDGPHLFFDPLYPAGREVQRDPDDLSDMLPKLPAPPLEVIESALQAMPNDGIDPRTPDWEGYRDIIFALHDGTGGSPEGRALALAWSERNPKHTLREFNDRWDRSRSKPGGVTIGTLIGLAKKFGWVDPRTAAKGESSDVLLARILARLMAGLHLYEHGGRGWLMWSNGAWVPCRLGEEREVAKKVGVQILAELTNDTDEDTRKKSFARAQRAMSAAGIDAMLRLAQSEPCLRVAPELFDRDPDLLNCANGVVHLPTGELRPHGPALLMSRQCSVECLPETGITLWLKFLADVSCNDAAWIGFLQRWCGYMLTGHVREEVLLFAVGRGANGKSVLANELRRILGNYHVVMPSGLLTVSNRDGEAATPGLVSLAGARMALANETEAGSRFSGQSIKTLASTEAIAARPLYGKPFSFPPTHKLFIRGNHKPIITDTDDGVWRRLLILTFNRQFAPHERDVQLEEKLMREAPGILAWMVAGAVEYYRHGLMVPECVLSASREYRNESDLIGQWLAESAEIGGRFECVQSEAFADYAAWCKSQEFRPMSRPAFTRALAERGFEDGRFSTRANRSRTYRGFQLLCSFQQIDYEPADLFV